MAPQHDVSAVVDASNSGSRMVGHPVSTSQPPAPGAEERMSPFLAIVVLYGVMILLVGAQMALFVWKKRHRKSYELITLLGLCLIPAMFSVHLRFWRFLLIWAVFSAITGSLFWKCTRKKLARTTPRQVYMFFLGVYRLSKVVGVIGYVLVLSELFGMGPLLHLVMPKDLPIDLVWYGLYFGILGRDCAQVATDSLSARLGMEGRQLTSRVNNCGICGNELCDELVPVSGSGEAPPQPPAERTVQLSCKHCFHDLCMRGWTMVGKKDTCPQCGEKVDLRSLLADRPWETHNITWIQMIDGIRYLVVWNPIIFTVLSFLLHFFGPPRHGDMHGPPALGQAPYSPPGVSLLSPATVVASVPTGPPTP